MPLNYEDALAVRPVVVNRCMAICINLALYLLNLPEATAQEKNWAAMTMRNPKAPAEQVSWYVIREPAFIADGSGITDVALQGVVETALRTHFIPAA